MRIFSGKMLAGIPSSHWRTPSVRMILPEHTALPGRRQGTHSCQQERQAGWGHRTPLPRPALPLEGLTSGRGSRAQHLGDCEPAQENHTLERSHHEIALFFSLSPGHWEAATLIKRSRTVFWYHPSQTSIPQIILRAFHHIQSKWKVWQPTHQK